METNEWRTSDLNLAAYLNLKHPIRRVTRTGPERALFAFDSSPEVEADVLAFVNRETIVEPLAFMERVRALKGSVPR